MENKFKQLAEDLHKISDSALILAAHDGDEVIAGKGNMFDIGAMMGDVYKRDIKAFMSVLASVFAQAEVDSQAKELLKEAIDKFNDEE